MSIASSGLNKNVGFDGLNDFLEGNNTQYEGSIFCSHSMNKIECKKHQ